MCVRKPPVRREPRNLVAHGIVVGLVVEHDVFPVYGRSGHDGKVRGPVVWRREGATRERMGRVVRVICPRLIAAIDGLQPYAIIRRLSHRVACHGSAEKESKQDRYKPCSQIDHQSDMASANTKMLPFY